jgi:4-amino-4-deoxy-L-arabinose transferase-like glycosyltransferase
MCIIPPLEMWDEYQHVAYIAYLHDTGKMPVLNSTPIPHALLRQMLQLPQCPGVIQQVGPHGEVGYADYWSGRRPPLDLRGLKLPIYESQHPPLYYWMMGTIYAVAGGSTNLIASVALLRGINLLFSAGALALVVIWLGQICSDRRHAMIASLWIGTNPLFLLNSVRVANDALAVALGTLFVVGVMRMDGRKLMRQCALLGMLLGLAILSKGTDLVLVPFAVFGLVLLAIRRQTKWAAAVGAGALILALAGLITFNYFWFNLAHYGLLVPLAEAVVNHNHQVPFSRLLELLRPKHWKTWSDILQSWFIWRGLWQGGWSDCPISKIEPQIYYVLIVAALVGAPLAWLFRRSGEKSAPLLFRDFRTPILALMLCALMLAGMVYHALQSWVAMGSPGTEPWYAALAIPWLMALLAAGAIAWRPSRVGYGIALAMPVFFLLTELHGAWFSMIRIYAAAPLSIKALKRLASLHPPSLGITTLLAATIGMLILLALSAVICIRSLAPAGQTPSP